MSRNLVHSWLHICSWPSSLAQAGLVEAYTAEKIMICNEGPHNDAYLRPKYSRPSVCLLYLNAAWFPSHSSWSCPCCRLRSAPTKMVFYYAYLKKVQYGIRASMQHSLFIICLYCSVFLCLFLSEPAAKINRAWVIWNQMCDNREWWFDFCHESGLSWEELWLLTFTTPSNTYLSYIFTYSLTPPPLHPPR